MPKQKIMATINLIAAISKEDSFNYETSKEWKYKDDVPAIIDFYVDGCCSCKAVVPILKELSAEYEGRLKIYKVKTEIEQENSSIFQIRSIPSILFCSSWRQTTDVAGWSTAKRYLDRCD